MALNILLILMGAFLIVFRDKYTQHHAKWQRKLFGVHFDAKKLEGSKIATVTIGIILIIVGVLSMLGLIPS